MAEKPKARNPETHTKETDIKTKSPGAVVKQAAPTAPSGEAPAKTKKASKKPETAQQVAPEERWSMIATAAYYHAEKRGFVGGDPAQDWSAAEAEIDAELSGGIK